MLPELLAGIVLGLHLLIAASITAGLLLVPIGAYRGWPWVRNRRLRLLHAGLMCFVAAEAVLGLSCPLTTLEYALRGGEAPEYFLSALLQEALYWDLPEAFFLTAYLVCAAWVLLLWWKVPPEQIRRL